MRSPFWAGSVLRFSPKGARLTSAPPMPLVRTVCLSEQFYWMKDGMLLPVGMRFGVESLT